MNTTIPDPARVLILGGTGGIGEVVARRLHERGARVALAARDTDRLETLASEVGNAPTWSIDARDPAAVEACAVEAAEALGGLTGIVNCVGSVMLKPAHRTSVEDWREVMGVNLDSAFGAVRGAVATMRKTGGALVLMSSAAAETGMANHEAIAAAKAGVSGLVRAAAASYAPYGLRVNAVAPGLVETPGTEKMLSAEVTRKASEAMHPLGRIGQPEDVARAILWLLDGTASWITGQTLGVDGGLGRVRGRK